MKVTTVEYSELRSLGDYNNVKIGVIVQLEDGENPKDAVRRARDFVGAKLLSIQRQDRYSDAQVDTATRILNGDQVRDRFTLAMRDPTEEERERAREVIQMTAENQAEF